MRYTIRSAIPGRLRLRYDKRRVSSRQAALAASLVSVQEGIESAEFNPLAASFLVRYLPEKISEGEVLAFFDAIDGKYLNNAELLSAIPAPAEAPSLAGELVSMAAVFFAKKLLPPALSAVFRFFRLAPRIAEGATCLLSGRVSDTRVLDAAAISASLLSGNTPTADGIAALLSAGEMIEEFTRRKSRDSLALAMLSGSDKARILLENGEEKEMPITAIKEGDTIIARTGESVQADGEVLRGEALVNQAAITGEPLAVEKRAGSTVFAGTIVEEGEIFILVRQTGKQTKVSKILAEVETSTELKVSLQKRAEALADRLVKYNFLLTALTFFFTRNATKTISTLMADYSCAMRIASPIAVLSAMREAAGRGIIAKGGKCLEEAARADTAVFDKTGTLTFASPSLSEIISFSSDASELELLRLAACLEEHYAHPIAKAIVAAADERGIKHPEIHAKVEYIVAHGIASYVGENRVLVGSAHFIFDDEKIEKPKNLKSLIVNAEERGESLLYLAGRGKLLAAFALFDPVRPNAPAVISALKDAGIKECVMITGDGEGAARVAAKSACVDSFISRALPEDKSKYVKAKIEEGRRVIMLGDGINDAPALACANAGIAMGEGAAIAGEAADIELPKGMGLEGVLAVRRLGKKLLERIDAINNNILVFNSLLIFSGLAGIISPSVSALLHNASTLLFAASSAKPLLEEQQWQAL